MKIIELELKGYKRLLLNNINYIKYSPVNTMQLILGSNGSGKSSLLKELSPLPAVPSDYAKDGYKIITIHFNNSIYILKSIFSSTGNKFNFIKDDEDLNQGGTSTVYRELVKKELNITQDTHDLLTGSKFFHNMSTAERREWFTKISDIDYVYAIKYYQRLREQLRDITGAIKLNQSRLLQESSKVMKDDEELKLKDDIANLYKLLSSVLEVKSSNYINKESIINELNIIDNNLTKLSNNLIVNSKTFINENNFTTINDIDDSIIDARSQISSITTNIDKLCKQIDSNQKMIDILNKTNLDSIKNIDNDIVNLNNQISSLYSLQKLFIEIIDAKNMYSSLMSVYDNLTEIAINIEPNIDKKINREAYINALNEQKNISIKIDSLNKEQASLINRKKELEHFKEHNKIECPKCNYTWHKGYSVKIYDETILKLDIIEKEIIYNIEKLNNINTSLENMKQYLELYKSYISLTKNWPILNNLWEYFLNTSIIFNEPRKIPSILETYKYEITNQIKIDQLKVKIKELENIKSLTSENQETDISKLIKITEDLDLELLDNNRRLQFIKLQLNKLINYKSIILNTNSSYNDIDNLISKRTIKYNELIASLRQDALNNIIQSIQLEITKQEQVISKIHIQKSLIHNLEEQLIELNDKLEILKIAEKELSPTQGLIAKGLTGFINNFILQMNNFIRQVWVYPLELLPVSINDDDAVDLDYKFSVNINDSDNVISDISKTSSAMREIINLAFRVITMYYLKLQNYPLYLDELGASFDKAHRESVSKLINNLMLTGNFSQIFIVSHYEEMYGSFKNTDINVLCSNNINIPDDSAFNKQLIIR